MILFDRSIYTPIFDYLFVIMTGSMLCLLATLVFARKDGENLKKEKRCQLCKNWIKDQNRRAKRIKR